MMLLNNTQTATTNYFTCRFVRIHFKQKFKFLVKKILKAQPQVQVVVFKTINLADLLKQFKVFHEPVLLFN